MKCSRCPDRAINERPALCKSHFVSYFEEKVRHCIEAYSLFRVDTHILVAVSGGKDSLVLLHILDKLGYHVGALAIDEGIAGYRPLKLEAFTSFCDKRKLSYKIVSFKDNYGKSLDEILPDMNELPCTVCGTLRRTLMNKSARGAEVIATGHNLDDESQAVIMNLLKNGLDLLSRQGPKSGTGGKNGFTQRVKPLYFCSEKEVMTYAFLEGIKTPFVECPYVASSFRARVRDYLNEYENTSPGAKLNILSGFLDIKSKLKEDIGSGEMSSCIKCGEPTTGTLCKTCRLLQ